MDNIKIEFDEVCPACNGTGLIKGRGEDDGSAVVCRVCNGTGCHHFVHVYEEFKQRQWKDGVKQVYQHNPGMAIREGDGYTLEEFGGISYDDWLKGKPFEKGSEMRKYVCPAWWYQGVDDEKKPEWDECISIGMFSECEMFKDKEKCWKKWDKIYAKK